MFKDLKTGTTYKIAIPVKQFTIETAYVGNTMVRLYENGIFQEERIIADYALSEMINYLTNHGYALVNDYQKALFEYNEAKDNFKEKYFYLKKLKRIVFLLKKIFLNLIKIKRIKVF